MFRKSSLELAHLDVGQVFSHGNRVCLSIGTTRFDEFKGHQPREPQVEALHGEMKQMDRDWARAPATGWVGEIHKIHKLEAFSDLLLNGQSIICFLFKTNEKCFLLKTNEKNPRKCRWLVVGAGGVQIWRGS